MAIPERTSTTRLEPFLLGSVLLHATLAGLLIYLVVPTSPTEVQATSPETQVTPPEQPEQQPVTELEREPVSPELSKLVREEVAREQLRPTFERLTRDALPMEEREDLWDALMDGLETELTELSDLLTHPDFDSLRFQQLAQKTREKLLAKLEEKLRAAETLARERSLAQKAESLARQLAENLKQALADRVGKPLGDQLAQAVQADQREGQTALRQAAQELQAAARATRQAEATLQQTQKNLEQAQQSLEAAQQKSDAKAQTQATAKIRAEQTKLTTAQKHLDQGKTAAQSAAQRLQDRHPEIAGQAQKAATQIEKESKEPAGRAASEVAQGKANSAATETKLAHEKAGEAAGTLEKLAQAVQIQAAREQIAQARREIEQAARAKEPAQSAEASKQVEKAEAITRAVQPQLEQSKQEAAAREVKAAGEKLQESRPHLAGKNPATAKPALDAAQARLDAADGHLRQAQEKLGVKPTDATEAALARLDDLRKGELARQVEQKLQPLLEQKIQAALAREPMARQAVTDKVNEELKKLAPGKVVADSAATRVPTPREPMTGEGPHAKGTIEKAQSAALAQLDRTLGPIAEAGVKSALHQMGIPAASELLRRLALLKNNSNSLGSGLLDLPDGDGGAGLRLRVQAARESQGRGRLREDGEAYRRMKEFIQDRERLIGDVVGRETASGPASKAAAEQNLQPAFVGMPAPRPAQTPPTVTDRKIPEPTFKTHRFSGIPLLPESAITLDGDLADWRDVPVLNLASVVKGTETKVKFRPANQLAQVAWSRRGLLLAFNVEDTTEGIEEVTAVQNFWSYDCVEIYLDALNTKSPGRGESHTHQFFVFPFGPKDQGENTGYESFMQGDSVRIVPYTQRTIQRAARKTARGWTLEVLISADLLRQADLVPGRIVGFNLQVDTGSDLYYYWTASEKFRTSMHPNTWGDLQLLGSDGRLSFLDEAGKKGATSLIPGKTLRAQVEDPDMNLNREKKDRVGLTLRTSAGEVRTLVLEETTPDSGIFEGTFATTLNVGGGPATVLPLYEGETITAEYLDQVRAFGERHQKVTNKLSVASTGSRFER